MSNGNGNGHKGTIVEAGKTILSSPVGGWALAVAIVTYTSWLTMQDRQMIYDDLNRLRETAMPLLKENNQLLKEMRSAIRIPSDNRTTIKEIRDMLKEWEAAAAADRVPTISNDQP